MRYEQLAIAFFNVGDTNCVQVNQRVSGTGFDGKHYEGEIDEIGDTFIFLKPQHPHTFKRLLVKETVAPL